MNWRKGKIWFFLILNLGLVFFATTEVNKVFAANELRTVKIGIYDNKPKTYLDDKDVASGLFPDILNYIAKQENWKLEYVFGTWEEGLARLERGEINVMVDVALSVERQKRFDFTNETILSSWGVICVRKDSSINSFKDLNNKKIAIVESSVYLGGPQGIDKYIEGFGMKAEFIKVQEYTKVFDLLNKSEVDAVVVSRIFALSNQKNYPNIKQTDMFFNPTELRFALTKGNPNNQYLTARLDYWIKKLRDGYDGVYQKSLENHDLAGIVVNKEVIPPWVRIAGYIAAVILLLSLLIITLLRRDRAITKRKLEEEQILLSSLVNHMPIVVFAFDNQGIITLAEGKALEDKKLKQDFSIGKSIFKQFEGNQTIIDQLKRVLEGSDVELKSELIGKMWRINISPIKKDGYMTSAVGVAVDLTEEIQLDHAKMEFLYLASHHLRTLPSIIRWSLELLAPKVEKILEKEELKHWINLEQANRRMIDLANSISNASQLELEKFYTSPKKFSLPTLIDEEIKEVKTLVKEKELKLTKNYNGVKEVVLDKSQVKTIVHTLLSNAMQYISSEGSVEVNLLTNGNEVTIKVKDTGWGIPKNQQDKVFTKLFRADNVIKRDVVGVGLGLFISKLIVDRLGGRFGFESEEGRGSTFYVMLPQKRG